MGSSMRGSGKTAETASTTTRTISTDATGGGAGWARCDGTGGENEEPRSMSQTGGGQVRTA
ncbi:MULTISPECIES: hypothetical protein [Pseudofrankia]|uniref:hypothetical protein n=1 Tax=Pseudofrankia TaxID=2994363 RepID=UPI00055AEA03|nr:MULTISPECIES: hypothetical protein [Pseudofrankia]